MTELPLLEVPLLLAFAVMLLVALSWCLSGLTSFSSSVHWILSHRTPFCMTLRQGVRMLFGRQKNDNSVPLARVMMIMGFPESGHSITENTTVKLIQFFHRNYMSACVSRHPYLHWLFRLSFWSTSVHWPGDRVFLISLQGSKH